MANVNYNKISANPPAEEKQTVTPEETTAVQTAQPEEPEVATIGIVANCSKLNIRKDPDIKSEVVCVVRARSELKIDMDESTDDWFKVCTAAGSEGFCMREYVNEQHTDIN